MGCLHTINDTQVYHNTQFQNSVSIPFQFVKEGAEEQGQRKLPHGHLHMYIRCSKNIPPGFRRNHKSFFVHAVFTVTTVLMSVRPHAFVPRRNRI